MRVRATGHCALRSGPRRLDANSRHTSFFSQYVTYQPVHGMPPPPPGVPVAQPYPHGVVAAPVLQRRVVGRRLSSQARLALTALVHVLTRCCSSQRADADRVLASAVIHCRRFFHSCDTQGKCWVGVLCLLAWPLMCVPCCMDSCHEDITEDSYVMPVRATRSRRHATHSLRQCGRRRRAQRCFHGRSA